MAIFPDRILKSVSSACGEVDPWVRKIGRDLLDTMRAHTRCVGLSAPQIGISSRVIAIDVTGHPKASAVHGALVLINPWITSRKGSEIGREGCLSLPDITADVRRSVFITVEALDVCGRKITLETSGFEARALQHEIDHLDGILILDRVASPAEIFQRRSY